MEPLRNTHETTIKILRVRAQELERVIESRTDEARKRDMGRRGISWAGKRTEGPVRIETSTNLKAKNVLD